MSFEPKRISELDLIPSFESGDLFVVVDVSDTAAGTTKKTTFLSLVNALGGGGGTTDASSITSGTLADARLSANVTIQGNTFNGVNQLVKLDGSGKLPGGSYSTAVTLKGNTFNGSSQLVELSAAGLYPSNNGSQITNLNATNIASGSITDTLLPVTIARTKKIVTPLITVTTVNLTDSASNRIFVCGHTTGVMLFNLDIITGAGAYFTIINLSTGEIQINSTGNITSPSGVGNVTLLGRSLRSRKVEIVCVDGSQFVVSGDLLP